MPAQLSLPVRLRDEATFANFLISPHNRLAVESLQRLVLQRGAGLLYLHGRAGSGKTHLLQAACQAAEAQAIDSAYLPLAQLRDARPEAVFAGLEACGLVCVDDLDAAAGEADWEAALFHLCNRCVEAGTVLLLAAVAPPAALGIALPDLGSRLGAALRFLLVALDDEEKCAAIVLRARSRGMVMGEDVARYILQRASRDMEALITVLERLDAASLEAGRRLTIPFVRDALGW
jgi:DnaA family protein